jgi:hypothetical protein
MGSMGPDDLDSEAYEEGDSEDYNDSEDYRAWHRARAARARRARLARARRIRLARARRARLARARARRIALTRRRRAAVRFGRTGRAVFDSRQSGTKGMTPMSTWLDDLDSELYDGEDVDSEDYGDAEDYDSEDYDSEDYGDAESYEARRRAARARRARAVRARRIARARRNRAAARGGRPSATVVRAATPRQVASAIRNVDLESKVGDDALRRDMEQANNRASRATYAAVAGVAVNQALDTFEDNLADNDFIRAGLRFAPLLLLAPQRKRPGLEGFALDPRVIGGAAVAGIIAADKLRSGVSKVVISPKTVTASGSGTFTAIVLDKNANLVSGPVKWTSTDPSVLTVDQTTGDYRVPGASRATVDVIATVKGHSETTTVTVN